jgi:hypothetical protein
MIGSVETQPAVADGLGERAGRWLRAQATSPVRLFVWLSLIFGLALIGVMPPFRSADEPSHFLRAYGIARGEFVPSERVDGRIGIRLPADLHADYSLFEDARYRFAERDTRYGEAFAEYRDRAPPRGTAPVFVPYQGSEAYTPAAYLHYAAVAFVGQIIGLDLLPMLYAMRVVGLLVSTAIVAAALALTPGLRWPLLLIALLPSALQGRVGISADGPAIALAILTAALALRGGIAGLPLQGIAPRTGWMTICILIKPSQLALAPIELLAWHRQRAALWRAALLALPGLLLTGLWVLLNGGEVAAWRLTDTGVPAEQLSIGWKLGFMAEHPRHFPQLLADSLWQQASALYAQLVGVLGWLDTPLRDWVYPVLGLALIVAMTDQITWPADERGWAFAVASLTAIGYLVFVYFLLYVTWTPATADQIWGVQGRYFLPALPAVTIAVAIALPKRRPETLAGVAAVAGACLSGFAAIDAVWRTNW